MTHILYNPKTDTETRCDGEPDERGYCIKCGCKLPNLMDKIELSGIKFTRSDYILQKLEDHKSDLQWLEGSNLEDFADNLRGIIKDFDSILIDLRKDVEIMNDNKNM